MINLPQKNGGDWFSLSLVGIHFAGMQFAFLFLLEEYLTSRSTTYFISLFFWLVGFIAGLQIKAPAAWGKLTLTGWVAYQVAFVLNQTYPYRDFLYPLLALAISLGALQAGYFFRAIGEQNDSRVSLALFHENNGFLVGMLLSLVMALFAGKFFLAIFPTLTTCAMMALLWRRRTASA